MAVIYYSVYEKSMDSHALLKKALQDYFDRNALPIGLDKMVITKDSEHGKPYLEGVPHVHFSISHSGKWWICAIDSNPIGLDLQEVPEKENNVEKLAKRFYHKRETMWLRGKSQEEFYRLWAYKESYVKYTGVGLLQGLDYFSVIPENGQVLGVEHAFQQEIIFKENYYLVLTSKEHCDITMKALHDE